MLYNKKNMKKIILIFLLYFLQISNLFAQKTAKTVEEEAKAWIAKFEKMDPLQKKQASSQLANFLNNTDNYTKGLWLAHLKNLNETNNSKNQKNITLKLVNSFDVDGMIILNFTNDNGEEFQFNSIEESLVNTYFKTNEDNETILLPEFLNKKFKVSYISKKVTNEEYEANGEDGEYIENHILKMTIINSNNNS